MGVAKVLATSTALLILVAAPASSQDTPENEKPPGTGVMCMAALLNVAVEIGKACYPEDNPVGQVRLQMQLKRLDDYMLLDPNWSPENLAKFKREQGGVGLQDRDSCDRLGKDTKGLYNGFVDLDSEELIESVDELTAKPGKPTWGDCL